MRIVNCMSTSPRVLITAFRLCHPTSPPNLAVATVPAPLDLAVASTNHSSYWQFLYSLLSTRRLFWGPCSILAGAVDAGGCPRTLGVPQGLDTSAWISSRGSLRRSSIHIVHAYEMHAYEMHACDMHVCDMHASTLICDTHAYMRCTPVCEVHAYV